MKIIKFKYIKTLRPNMSCGTGYSEPDKFHIICDNGYETDIWIDIWYLTEDNAEKEFVKSLNEKFGDSIDNIPEAFEIYKDALRTSTTCPYYWKI